MAHDYQRISADSHLDIDSKWWIERVPAKYRDRAPRVVRLSDGSDAWMVEGQPLMEAATALYGGKPLETYRPFGQSYETTPGTGPAAQRLREQDMDGLDAEVLYPAFTTGPALWRSIKDDDAYRSVVRAYNDFLAEDYCAVDRDRLVGLGVLPWTNVDDAIQEMERCAKKGLKGVTLGVFPDGEAYPTPEDDRFWAAALDMNMPLAVHVQLSRRESEPLVNYPGQSKELRERIGPRRELARKLLDYGRGGAVNAIQMVLDGVFDRFPSLRIYFAETQIGWIPLFFAEADFRYQRHRYWAEELVGQKKLAKLPSEYIREHCYWGFFAYDRVGVELRHHIGVEHVMWATDFPHQDTEWPNSWRAIERLFAGVPEEETQRMVCGNAIEYFHLDGAPALTAAPPQPAAARANTP